MILKGYVRSQRAGERVMALLQKLYANLKLKINEAKSAVASAYGRKFLGYALWAAPGEQVKRAVAAKPLAALKQRVRQITGRSRGRSMGQVIEQLREYLLGWKAYYRLSQTPGVWRKLDKWIRRRLRALQLNHWRTSKTARRELLRLGATPEVARSVAARSGRWWHNSFSAIHQVLDIAYFDRLGLPRLV